LIVEMSIEEESIIKIDDYNGLIINEYKGNFRIQEVQRGQNDVWYLRWTFLSEWKDGKSRASNNRRPMGILLGDNPKAILTEILRRIG